MAHKADLAKIGMEGFAMIDQFFGKQAVKPRARQNPVQHQHKRTAARGRQPVNQYIYYPQESHVHYESPVFATEGTVIRSNGAHEGPVFNDFSKRQPTSVGY